MNETNHPAASTVPWLTTDPRSREPESSTPRSADGAVSPIVSRLDHAVQGAHDTLDHLADSAKPAPRQAGERVAAAADALRARQARLRDTRDAWLESARTTVRSNPLVAVAAAAVLGALIARITR